MTDKRKNEIEIEARRRLALWLEHSTFDEMSVGYSFLRFSMSIGLDGYPFQKPDWMVNKKFEDIRKDSESRDDFFHDICKKLYNEEYAKMKQVV